MLCYSHFPHCSEKSSRVLHPLRNHLKKEPLAAFADYLHMGVWPLECVRILRFSSDFSHSTHNRPSDVFAYKTSQFRYGEGGGEGGEWAGKRFLFSIFFVEHMTKCHQQASDAMRRVKGATNGYVCVCVCVCVREGRGGCVAGACHKGVAFACWNIATAANKQRKDNKNWAMCLPHQTATSLIRTRRVIRIVDTSTHACVCPYKLDTCIDQMTNAAVIVFYLWIANCQRSWGSKCDESRRRKWFDCHPSDAPQLPVSQPHLSSHNLGIARGKENPFTFF